MFKQDPVVCFHKQKLRPRFEGTLRVCCATAGVGVHTNIATRPCDGRFVCFSSRSGNFPGMYFDLPPKKKLDDPG